MNINDHWKQFFIDENVRFPKFPKILDEIYIYEAPYGLGVQFNGGPHPLIIKGKNAKPIFGALKELMTGDNDWESIVSKVSSSHELDEVVHILRILQANSLLCNGIKSSNGKLNHSSQELYYNRILGRTGFNEKGSDVKRIIANTKVLVFSVGQTGKIVTEHMIRSGFENLSLYTIPDAFYDNYKKYNNFNVSLLNQDGIQGIEKQIKNIISDYRFIICALPNPSDWFLNLLNRVSIIENIPAFYFTKKNEDYEIGPYVIPKRTSCIFCKTMRSNSYDDDAPIRNAFQDHLEENEMIIGENAKGEDYITTLAAVSFFLSEVIKSITGYSFNNLANNNLKFDSINGVIKSQKIIRIPGCPECG